MLKYKGYTGHVEYDDDAEIFHGEVLDTRDVITFQGRSVEEIKQAFQDSIDDYLDFCAAEQVEPDRPFSGRLMLRVPRDLHRKVVIEARRQGKSLNEWITEALRKAS
jgi:predicted HicB family RNase H-like nuclease